MGFLSEILPEVLADLRAPGYDPPTSPPGPRPGFRAALEAGRDGAPLIAEFKRTSPGYGPGGWTARRTEEFLRQVDRPSVVALSVLATRPRFGGSPSDVAAIAANSGRPVLFKDFVLTVRQLDAARAAGASAVLLIARCARAAELERPLGDLADAAHARGLEVVLELHAEEELREVDRVPADVVGVNVRDLETLSLEPSIAGRTLKAARDAGVRPLLGMSGIRGPEDAARLRAQGAHALLVGTALGRSDDPGRFLDSLTEPRAGGRP